jgi:hypothetical protein
MTSSRQNLKLLLGDVEGGGRKGGSPGRARVSNASGSQPIKKNPAYIISNIFKTYIVIKDYKAIVIKYYNTTTINCIEY